MPVLFYMHRKNRVLSILLNVEFRLITNLFHDLFNEQFRVLFLP
jgi:hypothetical protein